MLTHSCTNAHKHTHPSAFEIHFCEAAFIFDAPRLSAAQKERKRGIYARAAVCCALNAWIIHQRTYAPKFAIYKQIPLMLCFSRSLASCAGAINEKQIHVKCDTLFPVGSYEISLRSMLQSAGLTFVSANLVIVTARDVAHGCEGRGKLIFVCFKCLFFAAASSRAI